MKKTLIALAAVAATSAFAQSSVTLYGVVDVAWVSKTHTAGNDSVHSKTSGISEGANAGNRIGFRGTEDLGGGLKANFVVEQGINVTNGNLFSTRAAAGGQQIDGVAASGNMPAGAYSTSTNRQSYLGLAGSFGEVRLGYQYNNLYSLSTLSGYMVGAEQPGGDMHVISNADFGGTRGNGITYISPDFSGFKVTLQHGAGAGRETVEFSNAANNTATGQGDVSQIRNSVLLSYNQGPLSASYAYTSYNARATAGSGTQLNNFGATGGATPSASNTSAALNQLGASYNFGVAKLAGTYSLGKRDDNITAANTSDYWGYQVGVEGYFGKARPFLMLGAGKVTNTTTTTGDYKTVQAGVRYDLSKRTTAYGMLGNIKDDAASATSSTAIGKREFVALGVAHSF